MTKLSHLAIVSISALFLGACASSPASPLDTGELITQRGDRISGYGSAWSAGEQQVASGERMVRKSVDRLENAREQLADAQAALAKAEARIQAAEAEKATGQIMISQGNQEMLRAEEDYTAARREPTREATAMPR